MWSNTLTRRSHVAFTASNTPTVNKYESWNNEYCRICRACTKMFFQGKTSVREESFQSKGRFLVKIISVLPKFNNCYFSFTPAAHNDHPRSQLTTTILVEIRYQGCHFDLIVLLGWKKLINGDKNLSFIEKFYGTTIFGMMTSKSDQFESSRTTSPRCYNRRSSLDLDSSNLKTTQTF